MPGIYNHGQPHFGAAHYHIMQLLFFLLYDVHLVDEAFATAELVDDEEYVADIDVDTTLQVVIEVDVAAE